VNPNITIITEASNSISVKRIKGLITILYLAK
jgi:hypothetical protein